MLQYSPESGVRPEAGLLLALLRLAASCRHSGTARPIVARCEPSTLQAHTAQPCTARLQCKVQATPDAIRVLRCEPRTLHCEPEKSVLQHDFSGSKAALRGIAIVPRLPDRRQASYPSTPQP